MANTYFSSFWIWIAIISSVAFVALQAALFMTLCVYVVDRVTGVRSGRKVYLKAIIACAVLSLVGGILVSSLNSFTVDYIFSATLGVTMAAVFAASLWIGEKKPRA